MGSLSEASWGPGHTRERLATCRATQVAAIRTEGPHGGGSGIVACVRVHPLDDVQQAGEVVGGAALGQVHQQLRGLLSHCQVPVLGYPTELGDHDHLYQLVLEDRGKE